jgi:hypothetical protein
MAQSSNTEGYKIYTTNPFGTYNRRPGRFGPLMETVHYLATAHLGACHD